MSEPARVAVVTGGGQGIGKAIVKGFAEKGYAVIIADIDAEGGRETADEFSALGEVSFIPTDVADEDQVIYLVMKAKQAYGGIDVVVSNAGIFAHKPVLQLTREEWDRVLAVNLTGGFLLAKHVATFLAQRKGSFITIASTRALMSEANTEAYSASKGGVAALTHALAVSLGPEVRVNCISPGWIDVSGWKKEVSGSRRA